MLATAGAPSVEEVGQVYGEDGAVALQATVDEPRIEAVERAGAGAPRVRTDRADRGVPGCVSGFVEVAGVAGAGGCYDYCFLQSNSSSAALWRLSVSIRAPSASPWRWPAWINSLSAVMASAWR